jgi:hypothetical protein
MALEDEIKDYIKRRLGHPIIKVELTDEHLDDALEDAKRYWQMWIGQCKAVMVSLTGRGEIDGSAIASDLDFVVDVTWEGTYADVGFEKIFAWADVEWNPYTYVFTAEGGYSDLAMYMQYREIGRGLASAIPEWDWDRDRRKLIMSPVPASGTRALIVYMSKNVDLEYLITYERHLFRQYALAQAMRTLATIRMKYSDKPSTTGGFSMDGDAMWANAEAIQADTEEKMRQLQSPVAFWAA